MKPFFLFILLLLMCLAGLAQRNYWQQQVNYIIDVRLNDSVHTLDGFEKIEYINNSPDTLHYIWFHIWPNAYKNDKTAFSDQLLLNRRTDFYFSDNSQRGYINRLDFRVEGVSAKTEDHPQHIDIIKIILPQPLAPGNKVELTTPFHVQLPYNFSRGGHIGKSYQITQWYPKPAVYDHEGWHPIPYLDQGEFYSEFGNFDVRITLPDPYLLASTGELQSEEHIVPKNKTLRYTQNKVHDFAWFADKDFTVKQDTLQLPSGRVIKLASYYYRSKVDKGWEKSVQFIKDALLFRSKLLGEYPYNVASVVQSHSDDGGMEYPTITLLDAPTEKGLDMVIEHELGHNWFYGILASNERRYPWMDEGMNSYYDDRYAEAKYGKPGFGMFDILGAGNGISKKLPKDENLFLQDIVVATKKDQPMNILADAFNEYNYNVISYLRTASMLHSMEAYAGKEVFDSAMRSYYEQWKFKHPYPDDFFKVMETETGKNLAEYRSYINVKETRPVFEPNRKPKLTAFFSAHDYKKYNYIGVLPAIGRNKYDGIMLGLGFYNYALPKNRFNFAVFPMYATNSKQFAGIGKVSYTWLPDKKIYSVQAGIIGSRFSMLAAKDSAGNKVFGGFYKIVPFVRAVFNNKDPRSMETWWLDLRSYQIGEKDFTYKLAVSDSNYYPIENNYETRYLNQLTLGTDNYRALYPYDAQLQLQQAKDFYRLNFTSNYFFNYAKGGGMNIRLFAAKFGYLDNASPAAQLNTFRYQPKLTAVRGDEDYTYSDYFYARNESDGFNGHQIMMRDGGLKLRTDIFQGLQGRSDNWVASMNFTSTLPDKLFPVKLPLKVFLDVGTYAEAWEKNAGTSRFLYVGGLQLSLFKNIVNIYAPIVFSSEFRDNLKTVPEEYKFFNRISFSIDIHTLSMRKLAPGLPIF